MSAGDGRHRPNYPPILLRGAACREKTSHVYNTLVTGTPFEFRHLLRLRKPNARDNCIGFGVVGYVLPLCGRYVRILSSSFVFHHKTRVLSPFVFTVAETRRLTYLNMVNLHFLVIASISALENNCSWP